jgi:tetratricopeptide (TPR) repeat protein
VAKISLNAQLQHWLQLAESHLLLDQIKTAEKYFRKVSKEEPTHLRVLLGLARIAQKRGKYREAIQQVEYALKVDAHHLPALILLAQLYIAQKSPLRALPLLEKAYDLEANHPETLLGLAHIYSTQAQWERARFFANLLVQLQPEWLDGWHILRTIAAGEGDILAYTAAANQIAFLDPQENSTHLKEDELQEQWAELEKVNTHAPNTAWPEYSDQELEAGMQEIQKAYHQES